MSDSSNNRADRVRQASRQRREQEKEELRNTILRAASDLFLEHGYERFSLRQVAEHIGYTPTTIYLYFEDKEDLLFTIVDDAFARFTYALRSAAQSTEHPIKRIIAIGEAYTRFGLENQAYYQIMFMQRGDYLLEARPNEEQPRINSFLVLYDAVQHAIDVGAFLPGDTLTISNALWAIRHGVVSLAISMPSIFDQDRIAAAVAESSKMVIQTYSNPEYLRHFDASS
jgi:AcrR family transcriptional regulator